MEDRTKRFTIERPINPLEPVTKIIDREAPLPFRPMEPTRKTR